MVCEQRHWGEVMIEILSSLINQWPSGDAMDPVTSSASMEDQVTSPLFFYAHEIRVPLNVNTHPVVDLQFLHLQQNWYLYTLPSCEHIPLSNFPPVSK